MAQSIVLTGQTFAAGKFRHVGSPLALKGDITPVAYFRASDMAVGTPAQITDLTGNGYHMTPPAYSGAVCPAVAANQVNGQSAFIHDATTTVASVLMAVPRPFEIWWVLKRKTFTTARFMAEMRLATLGAYLQAFSSTTVRSVMGGTTFTVTYGVGAWALLRVCGYAGLSGSNNSSIVLNNTPANTSPTSGDILVDIQQLHVGAQVGGTNYANMDWAELLVAQGQMGANNKQMMLTYLNRRYNLSIPTP